MRRCGTHRSSSVAGQPPPFMDTSETFVLLVYIQVCKFRSPVFTARGVAVRRGMDRGGGSGHCFGATVSVVLVLRRGHVSKRGQAWYGCLSSSGAVAVAVARVMPKPVVAVVSLFKKREEGFILMTAWWQNEPPRDSWAVYPVCIHPRGTLSRDNYPTHCH